MILSKYIFLNLGRKKKQTFFSLLCIIVSSMIILADYALINGIENRLKEAINRVMSGQITVYSSDNDRINILEAQLSEQNTFIWSDKEQEILQKEFPAIQVTQRIRTGSLIAFGEETSYIHFHALEDAHLEKVNNLLTFSAGRMPKDNNEIVISETVAKDLHCITGDTVLLIANNLYDYMSDAIAVVSGIFEERGVAIFLGYNGFMPFEAGKSLIEAGETESLELVINPKEERDFSSTEINNVKNIFVRHYPELKFATWDQTAPLLYSAVKVWQRGGIAMQIMFVLFSLIILITLTSLIVRSRKKELGTLLAIGFSWNKIKLLLTLEYALICLIAVLTAFLLLQTGLLTIGSRGIAIASKDMQSALMTDHLYPVLYFRNLLHVLILFLITTTGSTLITVRQLQKNKIQSLINH